MDDACDEYKEMMGVEKSLSSFRELLLKAVEAKRKKNMGEPQEEQAVEE